MGLILANPPQPLTKQASKSVPWHAPAPLRLWHLASLDAPTVAVTWAWAFSWAIKVALPAWILLLLGLVVWAIYIGDRLLDARPLQRARPGHPLQERHYFHWRYRRVLFPLAASSAAIALGLVYMRLSHVAIAKDSLVAAAAFAYFSGVHTPDEKPGLPRRVAKRLVSREFIVGVIFSAGCVLPLISLGAMKRLAAPALAALITAAVLFALLAWLNVRAIGHWESLVSVTRVRRAAWILAGAGAAFAIGLTPILPSISALVAAGAASAAMLGILDRFRMRFTPLALRVAADAVLLAPIVLMSARLGRL